MGFKTRRIWQRIRPGSRVGVGLAFIILMLACAMPGNGKGLLKLVQFRGAGAMAAGSYTYDPESAVLGLNVTSSSFTCGGP